MALSLDLPIGLDRLQQRTTVSHDSTLTSAPANRTLRPGLMLAEAATLVAVVVAFSAASNVTPSLVGLCGAAMLALWHVGLTAYTGGYSARPFSGGARAARASITSALMLGLMTMALAHLSWLPLSVGRILEATLTFAGAIVVTRWGTHVLGAHRTRRGLGLPRALIVGPDDPLDSPIDSASARERLRLDVVAHVTTGTSGELSQADIDDVVNQAHDTTASLVLVTGHLAPASWLNLRAAVAPLDVAVATVPHLPGMAPSRLRLSWAGEYPVLTADPAPAPLTHTLKQFLDRSLAALILLVISPVLLGAMLSIRLTSPGGAIFTQQRVARDGQHFTMYKLRTMCQDAEARVAELSAHNDGTGVLFKMHRDPRVTPIGRILRRLSLDELPQLWNVVIGDMSLVGPRPALPREVAEYDEDLRRRLRVRPGLTGLWQVSGRSDLSAEESARLDLLYVDNWSLGMDLRILGRTGSAVLGGRGAY